MKRIFPILLAAILMLSLLADDSQHALASESAPSRKISMVSTIFPGYDFTRAVAGDSVELTMLLPPGSESHSFEPTPQDILKIQNCDVFLYVGGESDTWVDGILDSMDTSHMTILSMMDLVETLEEEIKEGMEDDHGHDHGELDPDDIRDRALSDWAGTWASIEAALANGDLDAYVAHKAQENETDFDAQKAAYAQRWKADSPTLTITDSHVAWNGASVPYRYVGYKLVEDDHGAAVWYGFEVAEPSADAPAYLAFYDHGTGGHQEEDHQDEEPHEEEPHEGDDHDQETPHYHIRYGNDSFEALTALEGWSPLYFPAEASSGQIAQAMSGHGHAEEEHEYDEHVWTSPVNAMIITQAIADTLSALDEANAETYQSRCAASLAQLKELDAAFRDVVQSAPRKTLVFGDRFPFRYFVAEYGLDYYAAFPGCSTETEPSAKTVTFLMDKVMAESIPVVFHIEFSNEKMADTISESTGAAKLLLHSCHNITKADFEKGVTYLDLMTSNVEALKEALR